MRNYSFLDFFDKNGNNLNFDYDSTTNSWSGSIFIPKVSTGLFGVSQIFVIEQFEKSDGSTIYGFPEKIDTGSVWTLSWEAISPADIFLFQFDPNSDVSFLQKYDVIEVDLHEDPSAYELSSGIVVSDDVLQESLQINIALSSLSENIFQRILLVKDADGNTVLTCLVYGETEGVDPRLQTLMQNFGYKVDESTTPIFYNTDINEPLTDFITLNSKRKEMMLEGSNIYSYVGSYKSLINAINFFGFPDLSIREYWKNIDIQSDTFGKYKLGDPIVVGESHNLNNSPVQLPQSVFKKTNLFSLTFKINDETGTYDDYGLPVTEENYQYTIEEALIKLYGLKKILQQDYLPLNARIKDIIGEASYYGKNELEYIPSQSETQVYQLGINPSCEILPSSYVYLDDLREIDDLIFAQFTPYNIEKNIWVGAGTSTGWYPNPSVGEENNPAGEPYPGSAYTIADLTNVMLGYFTRYATNYAKQVSGLIPRGRAGGLYEDQPGVPVGAAVILKNTSFESITWANVNSTWKQLQSGQNYILDFEAGDPIHLNDVFIITDEYTSSSISYTALLGDTPQDVANGLETEWNIKIAASQEPWRRFVISVVNTTSGYVLRTEGIGIDEIGYKYDFQTSVTSSFVTKPTFVKEIIARGNLYTWETIGYGDFYEIEWEIQKGTTDVSPAYYLNTRGSLQDYDQYPVVLPYVGEYTVNLSLYDTFNNVSIGVDPCTIYVEPKVAEFTGFYRSFDPNAAWQTQSYEFEQFGAMWGIPVEPNLRWDQVNLTYDTLNYGSQIMLNTFKTFEDDFQLRNFQPSGDESFPGPYNWGNLNKAWLNLEDQWWSSVSVSGDQNASFRITSFTPNSNIYFSYGTTSTTVTIPITVTTLQELADFLNSETDQLASRFEYNAVQNVSESVVYVLAVAKYSGEHGNVTVTTDTGVNDIDNFSLGINYNPTWSDLKVINDSETLPQLSFVTFSYDSSLINGKDRAVWKITNNSDPNSEDIYFNSVYLTYLFKNSGNYTITLELQDSNTNKYELAKNMIMIK